MTRKDRERWRRMAVEYRQGNRLGGGNRPMGIPVGARLRRFGVGVSNSLAGRRQSCILPARIKVIR